MLVAHIAEIKLEHADDRFWMMGAMHVPAGGEVLV